MERRCPEAEVNSLTIGLAIGGSEKRRDTRAKVGLGGIQLPLQLWI